MSESESASFREIAQSNTRVCIDGEIVPAGEVAIKLTASETAVAVPLDIWIGSEALLHELNQAGETIDRRSLEEFVRLDLAENPDAAITGYLGIVHGILCSSQPKRIFGIFPRSEKPVKPRWRIAEITKVSSSGDSVILSGFAVPWNY